MSLENTLVIGCRGQVGKALLQVLGPNAKGMDSSQFNLDNLSQIRPALEEIKPRVVINAAAYTMVDKAESEREAARNINALAPELIAQYCAEKDIPFIHYSTDYVYPGTGTHVMTEDEKYGPCNYYGETKREGDERITAVGGKFLIFRTCWVYDAFGKNFVNTILRIAGEKEELSIVSDQFGAPSYAPDLAGATIMSLRAATIRGKKFPSGIYHLCNSGVTNWRDFAEAILGQAKEFGVKPKAQKILPMASEQYITPAKRPKNSRLSTEKLTKTFGVQMRPWQESLKECLREKFK